MDFEERQSLQHRRSNIGLSLPLTLWEVIDKFSDARGMNVSTAVAYLVREGLKVERAKAGNGHAPKE